MSADVPRGDCPRGGSLFYSWFPPVHEDTFQSEKGRMASGEKPKTSHRARSIRQRAWNREQRSILFGSISINPC